MVYMQELDFRLSEIERKLFRKFEDNITEKGYLYLSVPSIIDVEVIERQGLREVFNVESLGLCQGGTELKKLGGSAEQGILAHFSGKTIEKPMKIWANNQCFRQESLYDGLKHCLEFRKLEQFCFTTKQDWEKDFQELLENATEFLRNQNIQYRVVDTTERDEGYHLRKYDVEIKTERYGWMETHSCTYFGQEQSKRFNINGVNHTISNTGLASPRILLPYIENVQKQVV